MVFYQGQKEGNCNAQPILGGEMLGLKMTAQRMEKRRGETE